MERLKHCIDTLHELLTAEGARQIISVLTPPPSPPLPLPASPPSLKIIRTIDSLQLTATRSLATPANWQKGGSCMVLPSVSAEDAAEKFPEVKRHAFYV